MPDSAERERMETGCLTEQTRPLSEVLRERIIGQDACIERLICSFSRVLSGLRDPDRPLLTMLLLGPTGVGKTETAKALAYYLFGSDGALTRVNCEEYAHGHELAKLLGAPPGYIGYNNEPLLSQELIDAPHRQALAERTGMVGQSGDSREPAPGKKQECLSVILFDEIEKAHATLWNAMLGVLDTGKVTLGNNKTTDFTHSIIVMTSNVGTRRMSELRNRKRVGFRVSGKRGRPSGKALEKAALEAARERFPLEFLNRFDEILVYSELKRKHLKLIFEKFLGEIHQRAINQAGVPLLIKLTPEAKGFILDRGTDLLFGARPLRRAMEEELVDPLSRLIASHRVGAGDIVEIEREKDHLVFYRKATASMDVVV